MQTILNKRVDCIIVQIKQLVTLTAEMEKLYKETVEAYLTGHACPELNTMFERDNITLDDTNTFVRSVNDPIARKLNDLDKYVENLREGYGIPDPTDIRLESIFHVMNTTTTADLDVEAILPTYRNVLVFLEAYRAATFNKSGELIPPFTIVVTNALLNASNGDISLSMFLNQYDELPVERTTRVNMYITKYIVLSKLYHTCLYFARRLICIDTLSAAELKDILFTIILTAKDRVPVLLSLTPNRGILVKSVTSNIDRFSIRKDTTVKTICDIKLTTMYKR